jgi:protein tyrosine/serine phosphatase
MAVSVRRWGMVLAVGIAMALAVPLIGLLGYLGALHAGGNFHVVLPGELYRSAQPGAARIAEVVRNDGIRTILNLRGSSENAGWYRAEIETSAELGVNHVDFPMSDERQLSVAEAEQLIAIMRNAPKPLWIHCKAGSDRTGLAVALYLAAIAGKGEAAAEGQLSLQYGHISLPISPTFAMDESFERMEPSLGFFDS